MIVILHPMSRAEKPRSEELMWLLSKGVNIHSVILFPDEQVHGKGGYWTVTDIQGEDVFLAVSNEKGIPTPKVVGDSPIPHPARMLKGEIENDKAKIIKRIFEG